MDHKKNQPGREKARHPSLRPVSKPDDAADGGISRREFLGVAAASILLTHAEQQSPRRESGNGIPYRTLGRSGEKVSLIGLGGYHLGNQADPQESIRIIRAGLDEGDRKSTRLNSSHGYISYAVFCLKKKKSY